MSPERKEIVNGKKVEEYCWAGKMVVYVDNHSVEMTFEETCNALRDGRELQVKSFTVHKSTQPPAK